MCRSRNTPSRPVTLAYITNQGDNTVSVIDTSVNQVIKIIKVGKAPVGVAVSANYNVLIFLMLKAKKFPLSIHKITR